MTGPQERVAPVFPDGVDWSARIRPLRHSAWWAPVRGVEAQESMRQIRIAATRHDPLLFGLGYLPHLLRDGQGRTSFSQMHLDIAEHGRRWMLPERDRSAWVSHRDAGKSIWWFVIMPLWAMAHGHRSFFLCMSCTQDQASGVHLRRLKTVLERGGPLVADFPHLARGHPWIKTDITTEGGQRVVAGGMDKTILGLGNDADRPNGFIGDDLEPGPGKWTRASKAKALGQLQHDILPALAPEAAAVLVGTPTGVGSLMHDVVRAAKGRAGALEDGGRWVAGDEWSPHVYPALVVKDGREVSAWETRWPTEKLLRMRDGDPVTGEGGDPRVFALQRQCDPDDPSATKWWRDGEYPQGTFRYDEDFGGFGLYRILSGDPAVTDKASSDESAIAVLSVIGSTPATMRVCVERAVAGHWSPDEFWERYWALHREYGTSVWLVDVGNGGDYIVRGLTPPPGVSLETYRTDVDSKSYRAEALYDDYAAGLVFHRGRHVALEAEQVAWRWGQAKSPNLIDAVGAAERRALYGDPSKAPVRRSA